MLFIFYFFIISKPVYTSSVSFYTDYSDSSNLSILNPFLEQLDGDASELSFSVSDYISSDKFLNDILLNEYQINDELISLHDYWGDSDNLLVSLLRFNKALMLNKSLSEKEKKLFFAKKELRKKIGFYVDRKTGLNILTISVKNHPKLAQDITKKSYQSVLKYSNEVTNTKAAEKKEFIINRINEVKIQLENEENKMLRFMEENKIRQSPFLILEQERIQTNIDLNKQVFITLSDQLELSKIEEKDTTNSVFLLDQPSKPKMRIGFSLISGIFYSFIFSFILLFVFEIYAKRKELFFLGRAHSSIG